MRLSDLSAEFPRDAIHWRAQTLTRKGDKALALAYLDARDVMDRLDEVCGPAGWQDEYIETAKGRIICRIGIKIGDEWVWKSDGAGETAVEGEKGGISDALKRAAVKWGIGRYLYRLDAVWCPCETYNNKWSKWTDDPWNHVRGAKRQPVQKKEPEPFDAQDAVKRLEAAINNAGDLETLERFWGQANVKATYERLDEPKKNQVTAAYTKRAGYLGQEAA